MSLPDSCGCGTKPPAKRPARPMYRTDPETATVDLRGTPVEFDVNAARVLGDRDQPIRQKPVFARHEPKIHKITLEVTHACNLACRYCFVREQYPDDKAMPLTVAQKAFKRLLPKDRDIGVTFFGGEPLVAWDMLSQFVPWALGVCSERRVKLPAGGDRAQRCTFHVTTNGTLLSPSRIVFLKRNNFSFITSLDGPPDVHNAQRPMRKEGDDSHAATLRGLHLLGKAGLGRKNTIRATFDKPSLDGRDETWLVERMAYLVGLCRQGLAANVSIEPAFANCADVICIREASDGTDYVKSLEPAYWLAAEWYVRERREGRQVRFFHFDKFVDRIRKGVQQPTECGAGFGVCSVSPDGTVCACHRESGTAIGHIDDGIDEAARAPWLDNRLYARRGCMECWARYLCGGGCRMDSLLHLAEIHQPCPWECEFKRLLCRVALWIDRELKAWEER